MTGGIHAADRLPDGLRCPMQRVDVAGRDERVSEGRLVVRDPGPTGDGLLDEVLTIVGQKEGKKP